MTRLTALLILLGMGQALALGSYAQSTNLNLNFKNAGLEKVLAEIENQSEFFFLYNEDLIDVEQKVDVEARNKKINEILDQLFAGKDIRYFLIDRQIVLSNQQGETGISGRENITVQQQPAVSGTVTDEAGEPLPGVTVVVKGTTQGTVTNTDGEYSLTDIPEDATLVFSFVGMRTQEVEVDNQTTIDLTMEVDAIGIEEVVAVGYLTQRKIDLTGSVSVADVGSLAEIPSSNPMQSLQGRVPGLYIESSGDPSGRTRTAIIRGLNTLGNNDPLYIIDGTPSKRSSAFSNLDPNTISSIQILKDASAASIYGSRASNGVIIVTTKQGQEKFKIEVRSSITSQNNMRKVPVTNTEEYGRALWQASINDGTSPEEHSARYSYEWHTDENDVAVLDKVIPVEWLGGEEFRTRSADTDWQDEVFKTGWISSTNLTASGGTENSSLLFSLGYHYNDAPIIHNNFEKITIRINTSTKLLNEILTLGQNLNLAKTAELPMSGDHNGPGIRHFHSSTLINNTYFMQPILPVYTEDGDWAGPIGAGFSDRNNPVHYLYHHKDNRINDQLIFGDVYAELRPFNNLTLRTSLGLDYNNNFTWAIERTYQTGFLGRSTNFLERQQGHNLNWSWSNTANYLLELKEHTFDILLGMEAIEEDYQEMYGYKEDFADESFDYIQFGAGTGEDKVDGYRTGHQLLSYFGKVNYSWSNKYLASGTLRIDGSSRFGPENRFGVFPALTFGWRINNENFLKDVEPISNLKFRAGLGRVGNQEIGNEAWFGLYAPNYGALQGNRNIGTAYDLDGKNSGNLPSGYAAQQLANPDLKWEKTEELNIGLDFGFMEQKLNGSIDYYFRKTEDILTRPPYPAAMGEGGWQWVNGATMENRGAEFTLGYRSEIGELSYNINGSLSTFKDKITHLPESVVRSYPGNVEKTILGHSRTSVFGYVTDGLFKTQEEVDEHATQPGKGIGRIKFKDLNDDGKIDPLDQDWLGTTLPDFEYGINTDLSYKDFTLTFFIAGVSGKTVSDGVKGQTDFTFGQGMNFGKRVLEAWSPQNPDSNIPMLSLVDNNQERRTSNYYLVNGSYAKLRNVEIGYNIPQEFTQRVRIENLRIYLMSENLILIKPKGSQSFTGPDPETPGALYPRPVNFTLGFNLTL